MSEDKGSEYLETLERDLNQVANRYNYGSGRSFLDDLLDSKLFLNLDKLVQKPAVEIDDTFESLKEVTERFNSTPTSLNISINTGLIKIKPTT